MLVTRAFARLRAGLCAGLALRLLAGCDGPAHAPPPLKVQVASTDANGIATRGDDIVFTFSVTNTSGSDIPATTISFATDSAIAGVAPPLQTKSVTCSAEGGACPAITGTSIQGVTLAAGGTLTFTVTATVAADYGGQATEEFFLFSTRRDGSAGTRAHAALQDSRDAQYEIFSTSGRRTSALVTFASGASRLQDLSGATASFKVDAGGEVFADGSHFVSLPDMILGTHDFGTGPEAFIGGRAIDASPGMLDGATFTLFTRDSSGAGTPATAVRAAGISGNTLTICMDTAPEALDACPAASQWHYAFTVDGDAYTATDSLHGDTMKFQALMSGSTPFLLRAETVAGAGHFAIGVPSAAPPAGAPQFFGDVAGHWTAVQLEPSGYVSASFQGQAGFGPYGASAALLQVAGGPAGLRQATRASDGATLLLAGSEALAVQLGTPGELDLLALVAH